ncbi:uncharacterized protein [Rutidosis leptorrhynchoides]|uniref:uncharacterized protein n=1 Tax=Rutidosis leptorrhynchoides TaxID=125765 RepID=UPI003A99D23A
MVLDKKHTDHCPIILKEIDLDFGRKPTKVFDEWLKNKEAPDIAKFAWNLEVKSKRPDCVFRDKLKNVKQELRKMYNTNQGKLSAEIEELTLSINAWEKQAESSDLIESQLKDWIDTRDLLNQKEKTLNEMLKQKSRFKWAMEGDEKSKFFHSIIRRQHQKNNIHGVNIAGIWSSNPDDIKKEALSHFSSLFRKKGTDGLDLNDWGGSRLTPQMAEKLEARFCESEILNAIKSCGKNKAPGPDGFNVLFYTKF